MKQTSQITILDCTLRDGSYAIDYQFTAEDTALIAAGLEQAGLMFIEIGHGLGLNASNSGKGTAAATDREYLEAGRKVLKKAKFGMFFIPGIGREEDLKLAAELGMGFVRIGTNVTEVEQSAKYVDMAKSLGMIVSANLMKSYALTPSEFLRQAQKSERFGADILVVVDSAGGMLPKDVIDYVSILKQSTGLPVGYHGHNNLGLAISNTLEAIKAGATVVDATLRGMGRSAGNAQMEVLALLIERLGYSTGIDIYQTMDMAERLLTPMMRREQQGVTSIGAISGFAQFHSSFLSTIYKVAQKYNIDPRQLIVRVSEIDRINVSADLAERVAQELANELKQALTTKYVWPADFDLQTTPLKLHSIRETAEQLAREVFSLAKKSGKYPVFTIAGAYDPRKSRASFPFIRQNALCVIGNAEVVNSDEALEIAQAIDGFVDIILVDVDRREGKFLDLLSVIRQVAKKSLVLAYRDTEALTSAIDSFICQLIPELHDVRVSILGDNMVACRLALRLAERGAKVTIWGKDVERVRTIAQGLSLVLPQEHAANVSTASDPVDASRGAHLLVVSIPCLMIVDKDILDVMQNKGIVIDAGIGSINPDAIEHGIAHDFQLYRLDMRAGLSGEITTVLETFELTEKILGAYEEDGVRLVAGGVIGRKGDVVVDSIQHPTRVIGISDGCGGLLLGDEKNQYQQKVARAKAIMLNKIMQSNAHQE